MIRIRLGLGLGHLRGPPAEKSKKEATMKSPATIPTEHWLAVFLVGVVLLWATPHGALGVSLDRQGALVGPGPGYYVCHKDLQLVKAGLSEKAAPGQRLFAITLKTFCGVMPEVIMEGGSSKFGPVEWAPVMIHGSYDYKANWAVEVVEVQEPKLKALQANVQCTNNPWVTGQTCQLKSLANHTGSDAKFSYPVSAVLLPPSLRTALQKWEAGQASADDLADWNPGAAKASSPFTVVSPNLSSTIPAAGPSFQLSLAGPTAPATVVVKLEWVKLTAGKDPSIEPLVYHYGTPVAAPKTLTWSQLPASVSVPGVFLPGLYAVRAKVHTSEATEWRFFWIGPPNPNLAKHIPQTPSADARRAEFSKFAAGNFELSRLRQVILIGKGQSRLVNVSDLPKLKTGVARPVPAPAGPQTPGSTPTPRGTATPGR
jgi:hypothetical protein